MTAIDLSCIMAGRRCRVVVICACTDHPAMCKVGGFADKNHHEVPCTEGTVSAEDMYSDECLRGGALLTVLVIHLPIY